jgi:autotransporter-associated beta strand protein
MRMATAAVFLAAILFPALGEEAPDPEFPAGIRLPAAAKGEAAISALGNRLPEVAASYRSTPEQLRALFRSDHCLHADPEGRLFYGCEHQAPAAGAPASAKDIGTTDPAPFPTEEAFLLHSRPGAKRIIYLDFDGHVDNTPGGWKDGASAPPFDTNGDPAIFSSGERERIIYIWQRVAEDYSMFDIDVTTEDPGIESLRKTSSGDQIYGIRVVIGGSSGGAGDWYTSGVGGVAYVGSFDTSSDTPCWVFSENLGNSEKAISEAASHEAGHTLGLGHDGVTGGASYYSGQGNWAPIMGVGYYEQIVQWSKGEYTDANNTQDDLAIMLTQGAVYRPDDHGGTTAAATLLMADTIPLLADGVIEKRTDLDFFRISAAGGSLGITVKPAPRDSNLRIEVKLYDAAGTLLQTANSADTSDGTQPVTLTRSVAAGDYFFSVDGIGNGDPLTTGYSDYASLGQYLISITGVVPAGATWKPNAGGSYQWGTGTNWSVNPVPNGAGTTLRINNNIWGHQTINLSAAATVGSLFLGDSNGTHRFTIASTGGTLTFDSVSTTAGLSKTSGSNDVISAPLLLANNLVVTQSSSGTLSFSGAVSGAGSLTKEGAGTLVLTGAKTYNGATKVDDGVLRLDTTDALPTSNLVLSGGGVLGLASGNFSRTEGTAANEVRWLGDGGFAAFGANRTVTPGTMSWATTTLAGNTLILGHATADATLIWGSNISFAGGSRTIQVDDGSADVDARISGVLSSSGTFNKTGSGTLELTNSSNSYTATTSVNDGLLLISNASALPTANLVIGGGILGLGAGDFTARTIGTGTSQVQWTADGGFAAFGATRAVKFSATAINWTATNFIGGGKTLVLGHATADATLDWQQPISMYGGSRTVEVNDGSAQIDAVMSGLINGGTADNSPFNKTGEGTLAFTAQNTYSGDTIVAAGTLMIGNGGTTGGISQNSTNITVDSGATLAVNRSNTVIQGNNALKVAVSGDGDFAQIGGGTTILNLANTYTGDTTISDGTLEIGGTGTLGNGSYAGATSIGLGSVLKLSTSSNQTFSGPISGAGAIIKDTNSATLTLSGANFSFSGPVTVNTGILSLGHVNALGSASAITLAGGTRLVTALNGISIGAPITLGIAGTTSTVSFGIPTSAAAALNLNGPISGAGNLTFTTPNNDSGNFQQTVFLGSANSYGGSTQITTANQFNTLWVKAGIDNALPVTTVLTLNGGDGSGSGRTVAYDLAGHDQTLAGLTNVSGYTLRNQAIQNSTGTAATLTIQDNANRAFSGTINGTNLRLTKGGSGTFTISGANTFTGATTVSAGTLALGAGDVLADTTAVSIGNATLSIGAAFSDTLGTLDPTGPARINLGAGAALAFANSSAINWAGGTLTLTGSFVSGSSLRFGTSSSGLTGTQLSSITATGFTGFALDTNGFLTATAVTGYAGWKIANSSSQAIDLDHDGDGVSNGIEYFLGGTANTTGFTALPAVTNTAGTFSITWTKAVGYGGTYATDFWVETSSTLTGAWDTETLGVNVTITGNSVKYTFPAGTKKFARLKVTGP